MTYLSGENLGHFAKIPFFVILKMRLAIIVVAVITMPPGKSIANDTLADWLVVVEVLPWLCCRFLWPGLWLHRLCLKQRLNCKELHALVYPKNSSVLGNIFVQQAR